MGYNEHQDAEIHLQGETVKTFTYLGLSVGKDAEEVLDFIVKFIVLFLSAKLPHS